jgi:phosphatidylserine synthase
MTDFTCTQITVIVLILFIMAGGLLSVHKRKMNGFGPNTIRAIAVILFIPSLLILSFIDNMQHESLWTLWGAVAGYVLQRPSERDKE